MDKTELEGGETVNIEDMNRGIMIGELAIHMTDNNELKSKLESYVGVMKYLRGIAYTATIPGMIQGMAESASQRYNDYQAVSSGKMSLTEYVRRYPPMSYDMEAGMGFAKTIDAAINGDKDARGRIVGMAIMYIAFKFAGITAPKVSNVPKSPMVADLNPGTKINTLRGFLNVGKRVLSQMELFNTA